MPTRPAIFPRLLALLFIFKGSGNTDASDYTSADFNEIVNILRDDPELEHGLLFAFDSKAIPLALWEAVLGKLESIVKRNGRNNESWTFRTRDGVVTVFVNVHREGDPYIKQAGMPFLWAQEVKASVGVGDKTADREKLKHRILAIKRSIDKTLPDDPYAGKSPEEMRRIIATKADERNREERARQDRKDAELQADIDRLENERETANQNRRKADSDFHDGIKNYFRRGEPQRKALAKHEADWIVQRTKAIATARKNGKDWKALPLPSKAAVSAAIANGKPVPVIGTATSDPDSTRYKKPSSPTPNVGQSGKSGDDSKPPGTQTEKQPTTKPGNPTTKPDEPKSKPPGNTKIREQRIAELRKKALNKKVTLKAPYPTFEKNAPTDRISIQFAVREIGRQAGFQYDFAASLTNTNPICRRYVTPTIQGQTCRQALDSILKPAGLGYEIVNGSIILKRQ